MTAKDKEHSERLSSLERGGEGGDIIREFYKERLLLSYHHRARLLRSNGKKE